MIKDHRTVDGITGFAGGEPPYGPVSVEASELPGEEASAEPAIEEVEEQAVKINTAAKTIVIILICFDFFSITSYLKK